MFAVPEGGRPGPRPARPSRDGGRAPAGAGAMARQSGARRPERTEFWGILSRALTAQGRDEEAKAALSRAGAEPQARGG